MSGSDKSANREKVLIGFLILNVPTFSMATAWFLLFSIASAIGSKAPSSWEYLYMFWPALAGTALALASLFFAYRINQFVAAILGVVGIVVMPLAFQSKIQ